MMPWPFCDHHTAWVVYIDNHAGFHLEKSLGGKLDMAGRHARSMPFLGGSGGILPQENFEEKSSVR